MKTKPLIACLIMVMCALVTFMSAMPHHHHGDTACMSRDVDTKEGHEGRRCTSFCTASFNFYRQVKDEAAQHPADSHDLCAVLWQPSLTIGGREAEGKPTDGYAERMRPLHLKASKGLRSPPLHA